MKTTKSQEWLRNYSTQLTLSYNSSALIGHKLTSGNNRENQILDALKIILPEKFSLFKNVLIVDSEDRETIKYDGAIVDTQNWPKLYPANDLIVAPIESVKVVFEVKSNLGKTEIDKIYKEVRDIKESKVSSKDLPKIAAFSYTCANYKLAFYDFVDCFLKNPNNLPVVVCILNVGLFCFLNEDNRLDINPSDKSVPVFLHAENDSLLIFTYILTELISDVEITTVIRKYSNHLYQELSFFKFENVFLDKMKTDRSARFCFEGNKDKTLEEVYLIAVKQK